MSCRSAQSGDFDPIHVEDVALKGRRWSCLRCAGLQLPSEPRRHGGGKPDFMRSSRPWCVKRRGSRQSGSRQRLEPRTGISATRIEKLRGLRGGGIEGSRSRISSRSDVRHQRGDHWASRCIKQTTSPALASQTVPHVRWPSHDQGHGSPQRVFRCAANKLSARSGIFRKRCHHFRFAGEKPSTNSVGASSQFVEVPAARAASVEHPTWAPS